MQLDTVTSPDPAWHSALVMQVVNVPVWLSQISDRYNLKIARLDQVPDVALQEVAEDGITALWLLGIWRRSSASQRIKRSHGDQAALGSAYAIEEYVVSQDLGGEAALLSLKQQADSHGLKLAVDMVANHCAVDSPWIYGNPGWFIQDERPPFSNYRFTGQNLSSDPGISLVIEDGYRDRSDAAVVFRREDLNTGETCYIYHGNDGTGLPWNDTAQLDFTKQAVRDAVLKQILALARIFPVIRLDSAMTLTNYHYQRLWFPEKEGCGAIPGREKSGITGGAYQQRVPVEFWAQVIQEVEQQSKDTLLLAEAFWMTEPYFINDLGMHRVYNSAFMTCLERGDNHGFRRLLKEILVSNPEQLGRHVNYMSNLDESPAAEKFGEGERYFGVATLLATLPGVPLFSHGQVLGLRERYGMEYSEPRLEEKIEPGFQARHRREIGPLLLMRAQLSDGACFELLDFEGSGGEVDPAVIAFVNGASEQRVLVLFNHCNRPLTGRLIRSVPRKRGGVAGGRVTREPLSRLLSAKKERGNPLRWVELRTGETLELSGEMGDEEGLHVTLKPYETKVWTTHC